MIRLLPSVGLRTRLFVLLTTIVVLVVLTASAFTVRREVHRSFEIAQEHLLVASPEVDPELDAGRTLVAASTRKLALLLAASTERGPIEAALEQIAGESHHALFLWAPGNVTFVGGVPGLSKESEVAFRETGHGRLEVTIETDGSRATVDRQIVAAADFALADPQDPAWLVGRLYTVPQRAFGAAARADAVPFGAARDPASGFDQELLKIFVATGLVVLFLVTATFLRVIEPVRALTTAVERYGAGDRTARVAVKGRDEIAALAAAFNSMAATIERSEQLRRDLVADVAHELRTPLTNLRCQVESFEDGLADATPAALSSLHEEILHLSRIVADLQDLALADAGELTLARRRFAVAEVVLPIVRAMQARCAAAGVALEVALPDDLPALDADADRLGQVLRNLLENAVEHTPSGGRVQVSAAATAGRIELAVADTGPGIAPALRSRLFERFVRGDAARRRTDCGGAGLGLSIVKSLVEAHGGSVRVESATAAGSGARFVVTLPATRGAR